MLGAQSLDLSGNALGALDGTLFARCGALKALSAERSGLAQPLPAQLRGCPLATIKLGGNKLDAPHFAPLLYGGALASTPLGVSLTELDLRWRGVI